MVPCAAIENVVKSIAFEDDMGLRAAASTETEDYDRLLALYFPVVSATLRETKTTLGLAPGWLNSKSLYLRCYEKIQPFEPRAKIHN